jgi:quercetin dioxygenase-like cupin family protein
MPPTNADSGALPAAEAIDLAGLVEYQDGSIVSRTLAGHDAATVTLFAFATGQSLSEHTAPFDALVHILDGVAELTIDGNPILATTGQVVLMPADVPHALNAAEPFKMLLTMLRR